MAVSISAPDEDEVTASIAEMRDKIYNTLNAHIDEHEDGVDMHEIFVAIANVLGDTIARAINLGLVDYLTIARELSGIIGVYVAHDGSPEKVVGHA